MLQKSYKTSLFFTIFHTNFFLKYKMTRQASGRYYQKKERKD